MRKDRAVIGELAILLKGLDSAFTLVKAGIDRKRSLDEMSNEIGSFFKKKEAVEDAIIKAKNNGDSQMSSLEEARQIEDLEYQIQKQMESIGREYSRQGRSPAWSRIKANSARIQREKELKAKRKAERNDEDDELIKGLILVFVSMVGAVALIAGIVFLIFGAGSEI